MKWPWFHLLSLCLLLGSASQAQTSATAAIQQAPAPAASAHLSQERPMRITIGTHTFTADLADTAAAQELRQLLPLALNMQDHLRNEKHADLPRSLSRSDSRPGRIEAGDVMLWQGRTLVVFYESFDSAYSYTRLAKIRDAQALKSAAGGGAAQMRFVAD